MIYTDQMGRAVHLHEGPLRIVSLVPSQSELLWEMNLQEQLVGITRFCIHPDKMYRSIKRVGGTKKVDFAKIAALQPNLIIGNKEENSESDIKTLMKDYPVWMSEIYHLDDSLHMIQELGKITNRISEAESIRSKIAHAFHLLQEDFSTKKTKKALYLIWAKPYMAAGKGTFIHSMLTYAGFENVLNEAQHERYPVISEQEMVQLNPEFILLSSEPYPFKEKHIQAFKELLPHATILLVDGELFSWYGSRLLHSPGYFRRLQKSSP